MARRKHHMVPTNQMVPADHTQASFFDGTKPLAIANPPTNGHAPASRLGDDYWARALGKSSVPPVAPSPVDIRIRTDNTDPRSAEAVQPVDDTTASYWDRARGVAPRRPSLPKRPTAPPPAGAVSEAPAALKDAQVTTGDTAVVSAALLASEPAAGPTQSLGAERATAVRGAHVPKEDPLAAEVRGSHVKADDPLAGAAWETQLIEDDALADAVSGAHVKADDPLAATLSPAHAPKTPDPVEPSEAEVAESAAEAVRAKTRRRWGIVPVAGAAAALAAGLGGGGAFAYFTSHGQGTGSASAGTLQAVKVQAATVSPSTHLSPGVTGDVVLSVNNPNAFQVSLVSVSYGAITAVGGIGTCTTTGITLNTPTNLPLTLNVSGTTSVDLQGAATMGSTSQTGCQGATFSVVVTITVHK